MKKKIIALSVAVLMVSGCATNPQTGQYEIPKSVIGAGVGAATGAGIGALVGGKGKKGKTAAIGAAIGTAVGAGVGYYLDSQEQELKQTLQGTDAKVERQGNDLAVIMPGNVTFATGSATISGNAYSALNSVASVLVKSPTTTVTVAGYTDSVGSDSDNMTLSKNRATSVANYLVQQGVAQQRIEAVGFGESNPVASNDTDSGRSQNRRVEIKIHSPQQ